MRPAGLQRIGCAMHIEEFIRVQRHIDGVRSMVIDLAVDFCKDLMGWRWLPGTAELGVDGFSVQLLRDAGVAEIFYDTGVNGWVASVAVVDIAKELSDREYRDILDSLPEPTGRPKIQTL